MELISIFRLFGGVALFLFGMRIMGDGLKSVAGNKLELILYRLSNTIPKGVLLGTGVTAAIQSSCATSVMAVGFVNSGMMKLKQAVGVILGAILGTSITGWIICLNYIDGGSGIGSFVSSSAITSYVAFAGIIMVVFIKNKTVKHIGEILMGFAVLMFGMSTMSDAVSVFGEKEGFRHLFSSFSNPLAGILAGAAFAAVLQSASAAVGIVQALSVTGTLTLGSAIPLMMGIAIGASAPILLSAIGASANGKRTALVYPVTTVLSVIISASVFYILNIFLNFAFLETTANPFSTAAANTLVRLVMVAILLPFTGWIERLVTKLVRSRTEEENDGPVLEDIFVAHPALAVEQSRAAINEMAEKARTALFDSVSLLNDFGQEGYDRVEKYEKAVDKYEDKLGTYLVKLTERELTKAQNRDVSLFLHTLTDFERISDHALNIAESAAEMSEKNLDFSDEAEHELDVMTRAVRRIINIATDAFLTSDLALAKTVEPLEQVIDGLCETMKRNHIERLQSGKCTINLGFVLNDLLTNFERVSDHCSNIGVAIVELAEQEFDTHEYLDRIKDRHSDDFERLFYEFGEEYKL